MEKTNVFLYGASGHGKVIKEMIELNGGQAAGFIDYNLELSEYMGLPVAHTMEGQFPVIVSIGDNKNRKKVAESISGPFGISIHPSAIVSPTAKIGEGTVVMPGAIIGPDAVIGKHCIINTGASVDHECTLGNYVHIAPNVALCGQVSIGDGTLVGVGSSIILGIQIGEWCVIGAGAAVTKDIESRVLAVGVPAKVIKSLK